MSGLTRDGDISYGWRQLLSLIRVDGILLYMHSDIYWPCGSRK